MDTLILMSELISSELRSRTEAKKVLNLINSTNHANVLIDFKNVMSISRSFADEFCGIIENAKLTRNISVINKSRTVEIVLSIVENNRNKPKKVSTEGDTKEFSDMKDLSKFLMTV